MAQVMLGSVRDESCDLCALSNTCDRVCFMPESYDPTAQSIMIIMDSPSRDDDASGVITGSRILNAVCDKVVGIPDHLIYKTYLTKCRPSDGRPAKLQEVEECKKYLLEEIRLVNPKVIITLGENVMMGLLSISGITKMRGIMQDFKGIPVIPTFSPMYVEMQDSDPVWKNFAGDIQKAYHIAINYQADVSKTRITVVDTMQKFYQLVDYIKATGVCCFDFETFNVSESKDRSALDYWDEGFRVSGMGISFQPGSGYFIPIHHKEPIYDDKGKLIDFKAPVFVQPQIEEMMGVLDAEIFGNKEIRKVAHNLKFDVHAGRQIGINTHKGRYDDTMLMHAEWRTDLPHGLKEVVTMFWKDVAGYEDEVKKYG